MHRCELRAAMNQPLDRVEKARITIIIMYAKVSLYYNIRRPRGVFDYQASNPLAWPDQQRITRPPSPQKNGRLPPRTPSEDRPRLCDISPSPARYNGPRFLREARNRQLQMCSFVKDRKNGIMWASVSRRQALKTVLCDSSFSLLRFPPGGYYTAATAFAAWMTMIKEMYVWYVV